MEKPATINKPKKQINLGTIEPPKETETRQTLVEPAPRPIAPKKVDGRTLRQTGRTSQFNVMLSPEFREQIAQTSQIDRLTYPQLLTLMFRAYSELPPETKNTYITELMTTWGK
jgi:hypothetical protein